jgi:hypothetical protein
MEIEDQHQDNDEYILHFEFYANCSEQPQEWLDWLSKLGLDVRGAKTIDKELASLSDRELANAELTALSLTSSKYFISTQDILLENIKSPSCLEDKIRLSVLKRILIAYQLINSYSQQNEHQTKHDTKINDKLTEINKFLGYLIDDEHLLNVDAVIDSHAGKKPIGRRDNQIDLICKIAKQLEYVDLMAIPEGGKAAIKIECLKITNLFTPDAFKKAWQVANKLKLISMQDKDKYL